MKRKISISFSRAYTVILSLSLLVCFSCKDDFLETTLPSWLGSSIYDQLKVGYIGNSGTKHTFNYYTRLIDEVGYKEVLQLTGSKTVFVADDQAFEKFFKNNSWNVSSYEQLTLAQKKLILNSSMINNAFLIENLSTLEGPVKGQSLRHSTAFSVSDTIPFEPGINLPANTYWDRFRSSGLRLAKDNSPSLMLHFLQAQMDAHNISDNDFKILFNGVSHQKEDAYIYNDKVVERDITCQNGYIHILDSVLIPPSNMAEVIRNAPEIKTFSSFLERYAAPYYDVNLTNDFKLLGHNDSVFVKRYFANMNSRSDKKIIDPNGKEIKDCLLFDPGWNTYGSQTDFGAIFAPSDEALTKYFSQGAGHTLIDRYGSMNNIPDDVLVALMNNHMKTSFLGTIPSQFAYVVDDAQEPMGVSASHIKKTYLSSNGVVYVTSEVYPPALYSSVMYPTKINENMRIFYWAIINNKFDPYLLSMVNTYSFLIPTDNFTYIVPTSLKSVNPIAWKFHYSNARSVYASVHSYDPTKPYPQCIGDSLTEESRSSILSNHLRDMLDYHIIVGKLNPNQEYYRTKGGGTVRIVNDGNTLVCSGGGDIERNTSMPVLKVYDQSKETNSRGNGKSYVLNEPVQSPTRSVYSILSDDANYPQFSEFFKLLQGNDELWAANREQLAKFSVFYADASQAGLDYNVRFLNTYHYTLYVPDNDKVKEAIKNGLPTWEDVAAETVDSLRQRKANQIIRFLRYHFQDNAVFLDKMPVSSEYQTATLNTNTETFYKLKVSGGGTSLRITDGSGDAPAVVSNSVQGLYNIMARDFKFNSSKPANANTIITSSYIVIHQINRCLYYDGEKSELAQNVKSNIRKRTRKH